MDAENKQERFLASLGMTPGRTSEACPWWILRCRESEDAVLEGGQDVPEVVVRRRFNRSVRNFLVRYRRVADSWTMFDNSDATPATIAFEKQGELLTKSI